MKQQTLKHNMVFTGKGLHLGTESTVTIHPAPANTGLRLKTGGIEIPLNPNFADGSAHRTVFKGDDYEINTVEHLLSALFGMGVDNAIIELLGNEVPGMDGSARPFAEKIAEIGLEEQEAEARVLKLTRPVSVGTQGACITAFPGNKNEFRITYVLNYPETKLAQGMTELAINPEQIRKELAPSRTFVLKTHAEAMLKAGLGKGASTENTVVLDGDKVVDNQLRFPDECARHKLLDLLGDLATVGRRLNAHIVAYRSGHALNLELAKALLREASRQDNPHGLLDIRQIEKVLPHRYPFLLVDRVLELTPRQRIVAIKNVTRNEEFFNGHFPGQPIMPGVLQIEALAQTGGILMMEDPAAVNKLAVLMSIEDVKFRRPVVPGDQLCMEVVFEKFKGRIGVVNARSSVDGETATEVKIKFALVDPDQYT